MLTFADVTLRLAPLVLCAPALQLFIVALLLLEWPRFDAVYIWSYASILIDTRGPICARLSV